MNNRTSQQDSGRRTMLARIPGRAIMIGMLVSSPWMLGAVAGWAQALLCLCGLIALAFWWLEIAVLRPRHIVMPLSVLPIMLGIGLGILQFLPLPENVAQTLGANHAYEMWTDLSSPVAMDREMVDQLTLQTNRDSSGLLRPAVKSISIDPNATRLMTAQLVLAAICYLLGAHFFHDRRSLTWLCIFLTINGVALSLFGIVQKLSGTPGMIYGFIPVRGAIFGPYVNRNIASGLLVMCLAAAVMLAVRAFHDTSRSHHRYENDWWKSLLQTIYELDAKKIAAISSIVFIISGVVASLSRGGTLAVLGGAFVTFLMMGMQNRHSRGNSQSLLFLGFALLMGLGLVGWLGFGDKILERFEQAEQTENARVENWRDTAQLIPEQWLLGSGLNTYQHVHRPYRSSPERFLFVFAENQYYQSLLDGGIVGLTLLLIMIGWTIYYIQLLLKIHGSEYGFMIAILGGFALASEAISATFDFGLYMPANCITFAVLMGAIAGYAQAEAKRQGLRSRFALWGLGKLGVVVLLVLFSAGIISLYQFYHRAQLEHDCLAARTLVEQQRDASLEQVETTLTKLEQLSDLRADTEVQKFIARLHVLKFRLGQYQSLEGADGYTTELLDQIWDRTNPTTRSIFIKQQEEINPARAATLERNFRENPNLKNAVLPAYAALLKGRSSSPMDPELHLRLAELGSVLTDLTPIPHLDRATRIAPSNPGYQLLAGVFQLRHAKFDPLDPDYEPGLEHLRKAAELDFGTQSKMRSMVVKQNVLGAWVYGLDPTVFAKQLLLANPEALRSFIFRNPYFDQFPQQRDALITECIDQFPTEDFIAMQKLEHSQLIALARLANEIEDWDHLIEYAGTASNKSFSSTTALELKAIGLIERDDEGDIAAAEELLGDIKNPNKKKKLRDRIEQQRKRQADSRADN